MEAGADFTTALHRKLTETVQNALDAIRSANHPVVTIPNAHIGIIVKKIKGTNDLLIGISDPVGIPLNGIVALSVPFLSSKKPSAYVSGEIGSGFFSTYREAIGVFISTTVNGETTEILDTPILDADGKRIIDIQRCARVIKTGAPNGTTMFIQSRHSDDTFLAAAIDAITFVRDTIGLVSEAGLITLNKEPISIPLTLVFENQFFEFHMSTRSFGSYIMTKGVPFAPLYKYLTAMGFFKKFEWILNRFRMGVRLNVKSGVFTPVQTRTKIGLSDENTNIMILSILKAMPYVILFQLENKLISDKEIDTYVQYYSSTSDAKDVLPGSYGTNGWVANLNKLTSNLNMGEPERDRVIEELSQVASPFMAAALSERKIIPDPSRVVQTPSTSSASALLTSYGLGALTINPSWFPGISISQSLHPDAPNMNNLLHEGAKGWPDIGKIQRILTDKIYVDMGWPINKYPGSTIYNLAYQWLITKKQRPRKGPQKIGPDGKPIKDDDPQTTVKSPIHLPFCQIWVNTYCRVAQKVIANYPKNLPVVVFDLTILGGTLGSMNGLGLLTLFYSYMESPSMKGLELDDIIAVFSKKSDPAADVLNLDVSNSVWRQFFMPKGTIAHELEHFRMGNNHAHGDHDAVTMNLPYGGNKKRVFLIQHHDLMMSLVQAGFYEEVRKAWVQYTVTGKI